MLFNKKVYCTHSKPRTVLRLLSIITTLSMLTACTTTYIPGIDQVLFPNSTAKVGPLITASEQYPTNNEVTVDSSRTELSVTSTIESIPTASVKAQKAIVEKKLEPAAKKASNVIEPIVKKPNDSNVATIQKVELTRVKPVDRNSKTEAAKASIAKASKSKASKPEEVAAQSGSINGRVLLLDGNGISLSAQGTLITLTPKTPAEQTTPSAPTTHVIDMQDKEYQTRYSSINTGDQVVFVNKDKIQHNVFSSSGSNAFDLGTYGAGLKRAVTLKEPGVVKVYCNIHADMATFIAVGKEGLSAKADDQGRYQITDLPLGLYDLTIWNIRGETTRTIEVTAGSTSLKDSINTVASQTDTHKNKFGNKYSKSGLFKDEFY